MATLNKLFRVTHVVILFFSSFAVLLSSISIKLCSPRQGQNIVARAKYLAYLIMYKQHFHIWTYNFSVSSHHPHLVH